MHQTLAITEIFHSIQGESTRAGRRCAFVRLAGCNLDCAWCDTNYSRHEPGRELTVDMIVEAVRPYGARLVEITGGEPLWQPATPLLAKLLLEEGHDVIIETNGSLDVSVLPHGVGVIMDLKPPSSGMARHNRMENLVHLGRGDEVKIVVADRMDYTWARTIITEPSYPRGTVETLLSPLSGRLPAAELAAWMLEDKLDARLNIQLHKVIWPDIDRGV